MKYSTKLILSILILMLSVSVTIYSFLNITNGFSYIIYMIASVLSAFANTFICLIPLCSRNISINSSQFDPNFYNYDKKSFVDRKEIYNEIINQIKALDITKEKTMWIRLFGINGIGKKTLVSKIFQKYKYPKNKFYFLNNENGTGIINQLSVKYPLKNESYNESIYLHKLSRSKRTFIVISSDYSNINNHITAMMSAWNENVTNKNKLIFITLDSNSTISNLKNQSYIFEYELKKLGNEDALKFIKKLVKNKVSVNKTDIIKISDGLPATIKFICEQYNNQRNIIETTNWLEEYLKLYDDIKLCFLEFCILTLTVGRFAEVSAKKITDEDNINYFISKKILIKSKDGEYYVPVWLINAIIISNQYNKELLLAVKNLSDTLDLDKNKIKKMNILVNKDMKELAEYLKDLEQKESYTDIKEIYDKLLIKYNYEDCLQKEILMIFMKTLLKLGEYGLFGSLYPEYSIPITMNISYIDFRINILIADYYHLTSQYDKSNTIFQALLFNTELGKKHTCELNFYLAHNYRHQGKLDKAKVLFNEILTINDINNDYYVRSVTSIVSIDYFEDVNFIAKDGINRLIPLLKNETVQYNVYRHIANIYKRNYNTLDEAIKLLEEKINILEKKQLRILQDYYFELAECYRLKCKTNNAYYNLSLTYYNKALLFAELNHDINLKINTQIGKYLLRYLKDHRAENLRKDLEDLIKEAEMSDIIHYCILTILAILNKTDISKQLKSRNFYHYLKVLRSGNVNSIYITVM